MKTAATRVRSQRLGWPRLMVSKTTGAVVLAAYGDLWNFDGTIIHNDHNNGGQPIGTHSTSWVLSAFEPFHGVVTIDTESSE